MPNSLIYFLFALSGISGLIYEGTWARYLKLFLGHSSYGQILTLCVYMGGLALGSFIAGKMVVRIKRPLLAYGIAELLIGFGGMFYHPLYVFATNLFYDSEWSRTLGSSGAEAIKIIIATSSTLPIAILLGTTFPLIAAGLSRQDKDGGKTSLPLLYFTNSLGACFGILLASYILIPTLGNANTLRIAGCINFVLFAFFWRIAKYNGVSQEKQPQGTASVNANYSVPKSVKLWLLFAALTGLTSFIYEIVWIRLLSLLMGSSSHSFDQMLSAFILGLALGGLACRKFLARNFEPLKLLAFSQVLMAFFAVCTLYFHVPFFTLMNEAHQIFNQTSTGYIFWSIFKYILAVFWMVPTSFFAGMTLPVLTYWLINKTGSESYVGSVYGWNTIGAIIGSVGTGLLLLPQLQLKGALLIGVFIDLILGIVILFKFFPEYRKNFAFAAICILAFLPSIFITFDNDRITSGIFRSYRLIKENEDIDVRNGKTATISLHNAENISYIKTNGKADASLMRDRSNPIEGDELTQAATAFIPMAMRNAPYNAAMVGLGSGMGSHYLLADPLLNRLDCIEIEEEMVNLAKKGFYPYNKRSFDDPRMFLHIGDARTFFHTQNLSYDLIISVPSNPWVSGVSSLFSLEFYHHIKRYLNKGGHLVQWLQLYEFNNELLLHIIKALDESFEHVAVYRAPDEPDIIMVASDEPVFQEHIERFKTDSVLVEEFKTMRLPWYFFSEQNFLFKSSSIRPALEMVEANSEYIPVVDNKAEQARFVNTYVGFISAFDSCQVCWSMLLDSTDYAPRKAFMDELGPQLPRNRYLEKHLLLSLRNRGKHFDWESFWEDYRKWSVNAPFSEERDNIPLYEELMDVVLEGDLPVSIALEAKFMDLAMHGQYAEAAKLIPLIDEFLELRGADEFFLRHLFIVGMLGGERDYLRNMFLKVYMPNKFFDKAEKYIMKTVSGVPDKVRKSVLQERAVKEN
ncbi:MAG: spermidine synthase [Fibromonadaceae bacterium]|nr:spermidine synthase [Fibromonadaceae bacterium]